MNERIHAWLDGDLAFEDLTADEQERARSVEAGLEIAASLQDVRSPGLTARVMDRLPPGAPRPSVLGSVFARVRHAFAVTAVRRPAFTLAAAALAVGFGLGLQVERSRSAAPDPTVAAGQPEVFVRFELELSGATTVQLAGSFSDWKPAYDLVPAGDEHWAVTVPLEPGVHDYVFIVDGAQYVLDPTAPRFSDGFGSFSNRIALLASAP